MLLLLFAMLLALVALLLLLLFPAAELLLGYDNSSFSLIDRVGYVRVTL